MNNKNMNLDNLQYQIVVNRNASDGEIAALREASFEAGMAGTPVEKTGDTTALGADGASEIILLLKYTGIILVNGILAAIGTDVWNHIKKFVIITFKKYKKRFNPEKQWRYTPIIVVDININEKSVVQIHFPGRDEKELKKSIESLWEIFNLHDGEDFTAFNFNEKKWTKTTERFKSQKQIRDEIFGGKMGSVTIYDQDY